MILPKGTPVWQELNTFFVDMQKLIQFIRKQDFNGYIYCRFASDRGVIFLQEGDAVCGMIDDGDRKTRGSKAVKDLLERTRADEEVSLDVTALPLRSVDIITEVLLLAVKPYETDLSAEFLDIEKYVYSRLNKDSFTGYVEIHFDDDKEGIIFLRGGEVQSIVTESLQINRNTATQSELKMFDIYALKLFERAKGMGARYDVFART